MTIKHSPGVLFLTDNSQYLVKMPLSSLYMNMPVKSPDYRTCSGLLVKNKTKQIIFCQSLFIGKVFKLFMERGERDLKIETYVHKNS